MHEKLTWCIIGILWDNLLVIHKISIKFHKMQDMLPLAHPCLSQVNIIAYHRSQGTVKNAAHKLLPTGTPHCQLAGRNTEMKSTVKNAAHKLLPTGGPHCQLAGRKTEMKSRSRSYRLLMQWNSMKEPPSICFCPHSQHNQTSPGLNMQFLPTASTSYG